MLICSTVSAPLNTTQNASKPTILTTTKYKTFPKFYPQMAFGHSPPVFF